MGGDAHFGPVRLTRRAATASDTLSLPARPVLTPTLARRPGTGNEEGLSHGRATVVFMPVLDRLSPSKISAFRACPTAFAFRYVDGLDEPANRWMIRGTLVHEVCERLFNLPPEERTLAAAAVLLDRLWERMVDEDQALRDLFATAEDATTWLMSAQHLLVTWFRLECPSAIDVVGRELFVSGPGPDGVTLAGIVDRVDRLPDGSLAIVDYKTGSAPGRGWERREFFQLRFYAVLVAAALGAPVSTLRLVHLAGDGEVLALDIDADAAGATVRQVQALNTTMRQAYESSQWATNVGRHCDWCAFKQRCPAWAPAT